MNTCTIWFGTHEIEIKSNQDEGYQMMKIEQEKGMKEYERMVSNKEKKRCYHYQLLYSSVIAKKYVYVELCHVLQSSLSNWMQSFCSFIIFVFISHSKEWRLHDSFENTQPHAIICISCGKYTIHNGVCNCLYTECFRIGMGQYSKVQIPDLSLTRTKISMNTLPNPSFNILDPLPFTLRQAY